MGVANVTSEWSSGNLIFLERVQGSGASIQFGEDDNGLDVVFRGETSGSTLTWDESADALEFSGAATLALEQTAKAMKAGTFGTHVQWDGADEWIELFVETTDTTPGKPVMRLRHINDATVTSGGCRALQVQSNLTASTDITSAGYPGWCALDLAVEFKGTNTYTAGHVQAIHAAVEVPSGCTLSGSDLRVGYFYLRSQTAQAGVAQILRLENNCSTGSTCKTFLSLVNDDTQYTMTCGPVQDGTAWNGSDAGTGGTKAGYLKVQVGSADRYIRLYDSGS